MLEEHGLVYMLCYDQSNSCLGCAKHAIKYFCFSGFSVARGLEGIYWKKNESLPNMVASKPMIGLCGWNWGFAETASAFFDTFANSIICLNRGEYPPATGCTARTVSLRKLNPGFGSYETHAQDVNCTSTDWSHVRTQFKSSLLRPSIFALNVLLPAMLSKQSMYVRRRMRT